MSNFKFTLNRLSPSLTLVRFINNIHVLMSPCEATLKQQLLKLQSKQTKQFFTSGLAGIRGFILVQQYTKLKSCQRRDENQITNSSGQTPQRCSLSLPYCENVAWFWWSSSFRSIQDNRRFILIFLCESLALSNCCRSEPVWGDWGKERKHKGQNFHSNW